MADPLPRTAPQTTEQSASGSALAILGVVLLIMAGFAVFFFSFLLAPLAVLVIFYVVYFAVERSRKTRGGTGAPSPEASERMLREAEARQREIERERVGIGVEEALGRVPREDNR
jgi:hypothetical protein